MSYRILENVCIHGLSKE